MIGWGAHFQVSGLSHQEPGTGDQVRVQELCPLSSVIDSALFYSQPLSAITYYLRTTSQLACRRR